MKQIFTLFAIGSLSSMPLFAQLPTPTLLGYWHNWQTSSAPYIPLDQVDSRYNTVAVAFALPKSGTDYDMTFAPDQGTVADFKTKIQTLQSQGRKVLLSVGGATGSLSLSNTTERDVFASSLLSILTNYGFDGCDIDIEGNAFSVSGGTIANPIDAPIVHMIAAIKTIMQGYRVAKGKQMILTMAPETAYVQGGMSAYSGIWGAYLPVIHALRDSLALLHVQLYNSGTMYGINGNIYTQGTADFIVAMTEAVIRGFNTNGGAFVGLPAHKVAVGLPSCPSAAGGGFVNVSVVASAIQYLKGTGPKPSNYTLAQAGGYSTLGGMMTWSINWDAVSTCNSASYKFAQNYQTLFGGSIPITLQSFSGQVRGYSNHLTWQTASEFAVSRFDVESSFDGKTFEKIREVRANNTPSVYEHLDALSDKNMNKLIYYRLVIQDMDGTTHFSKIISIDRTKGLKTAIYPNPVNDVLTIDNAEGQSVEIINLLGQVVVSAWSNNSTFSINIQHLNNGMYFLKTLDAVIPFVKK